jgi:broad specificity phosphatase PhoE
MTLYLLRHAQAGTRHDWKGEDRTRPLTAAGRYQAADLVGMLAEMGIDHIHTSPYRRCVETAAPLAARLGISLHITEALAEGPHDKALLMARGLADENTLFCSHGDIIPALLDTFAFSDGLDLGPHPKCQKGSVWVIEPSVDRKSMVRAQYIAPAR